MTDTAPPKLPRRHADTGGLARLRRHTDARVALGRAGSGMPTGAVLGFALDHARARDAVHSSLDGDRLAEELAALGHAPLRLRSAAGTRQEYLTRPDLGRRLDADSAARLKVAPRRDLAITVADGLSATATNMNAVPLAGALLARLPADTAVGIALLSHGRVAAGDAVALGLDAEAALILIGERPGLSAADSLGAYLTWRPRPDSADAERFCVSNIRLGGLGIDRAADQIVALLERSRALGHSGVAGKAALD